MRGPRLLAGVAFLSIALLAGCSLLLDSQPTLPADASPAVWHLDPDAPPPGPESTTFVALVTEQACSGARDVSGLVLPPVIQYGAGQVIVSVYVAPLPAGAHECPGNPATRVTIELDEPLGDRQLVDGIGGSEDDST